MASRLLREAWSESRLGGSVAATGSGSKGEEETAAVSGGRKKSFRGAMASTGGEQQTSTDKPSTVRSSAASVGGRRVPAAARAALSAASHACADSTVGAVISKTSSVLTCTHEHVYRTSFNRINNAP